jgi:cytochrome P450
MTMLVEDSYDIPFGPGLAPADSALATRAVARDTSFLGEISDAEDQFPLPGPPRVEDPDGAASFAAAAKIRSGAIGRIIARWLAAAPLKLLQELLNQPKDKLPFFKPIVGPVMVFRHEHVITCLQRTDLFTVDPYAAEMARATDDKAKRPDAFSHFLLGTDREDLYRLDDVILRRAVSRRDEELLSTMCRQEAERWTRQAREAGSGEIEVVGTIATFVPMRVVADYLGVPWCESGQESVLAGLRGGDRFALDDPDLQAVYTFTKIQEGLVPTATDLFGWVKDAFRNAFNNFSPLHPLFAHFRERGIVATEYLTAYIHSLIKEYKSRLSKGQPVPDTMLTRLVRMQLQVSRGEGAELERDLSTLLGGPIPEGELARRLSDSMIRSNVFAAVVGALINPQEATARIVDAMLRVKDGECEVLPGSSYEEAVRLAGVEEGHADYQASLEKLRRFALEGLRLHPQGEILVRLCVQENTVLSGVKVRKGTPVFVAYAGAMRDPEVIPKPLAFDVNRDEMLLAYLSNRERSREAPQSLLYLQHGYGRHKCLGRYASEITMRESLRALLRLGTLERRSELLMDEQLLYPACLNVAFS